MHLMVSPSLELGMTLLGNARNSSTSRGSGLGDPGLGEFGFLEH